MPFSGKCPICNTHLAFPDVSPVDPVRCPECNSRFKLEGRNIAHLSFTDFYSLLEIPPGASDGEVRKAVRAKILEHHPDRNPNDPKATDRLREIVQAKELLTDPAKRRIYNSVFYATALPRWTQQPHRERYYPTQPRAKVKDIRSDYANDTERVRAQSRMASSNDIGHLIDEIEIIFMQAGVPINLSGKRGYREYSKVLAQWHWVGVISLALAGFLFGYLNGKLAGALILAVLGGAIGWILTSYPGGLVALALFIARMFIFSFPLALIAAKITTGEWLPGDLKTVLTVLNGAAFVGAAGLGLWWIGVCTFRGREPYYVNHMVHRQAALGAWIGALWAFFILYALDLSNAPLHSSIGLWLIFFTAYLFLDVQVFGRTWIIVRGRR